MGCALCMRACLCLDARVNFCVRVRLSVFKCKCPSAWISEQVCLSFGVSFGIHVCIQCLYVHVSVMCV